MPHTPPSLHPSDGRSTPVALALCVESQDGLYMAHEALALARIENVVETVGHAPTGLEGAQLLYLEIANASDLAEAILSAAARSRRPAIVVFPETAIDLVASYMGTAPALLLCQPTLVERVAALAMMAVHTSQETVAEEATDVEAARLGAIAAEVNRIGKLLAQLAAEDNGPRADGFSDGMIGYRVAQPLPTQKPQVSAAEIRHLIRLRRMRDRHFDAEYFADPIWDMLLDLMAARLEGTPVSVSSLCIAAAVPATTALRAIRQMTDAGLFLRVADPHDRRRVFIILSEAAAESMAQYLQHALSGPVTFTGL